MIQKPPSSTSEIKEKIAWTRESPMVVNCLDFPSGMDLHSQRPEVRQLTALSYQPMLSEGKPSSSRSWIFPRLINMGVSRPRPSAPLGQLRTVLLVPELPRGFAEALWPHCSATSPTAHSSLHPFPSTSADLGHPTCDTNLGDNITQGAEGNSSMASSYRMT